MNTQADLAAAEAELEKQRALNDKLETDLLQLETHHPKGVNGDVTPAEVDVLAGLDLGKKTASPARNSPIPFTSAADTSILPIVTSQRDRFRQRNGELEEVNQFSVVCGYSR